MSIKLTAEFLKNQVIQHAITFWPVRSCSICDAPIGYVFYNGIPEFDGSCSCASGSLRPSTWDDIVSLIQIQTHEAVQQKYQAFWGYGELTDDDD